MRLLDRYIARYVVSATGLVMLLLLGLEGFLKLVYELHDIGTYHYGVSQAIWYVMLILPNDLYQLFPVAGLLGALLGLGVLASRSELIVMRCSGASRFQIMKSVLKAALWMILIAAIVGEVLAPKLLRVAEQYRSVKHTETSFAVGQQNVWLQDGSDVYYIRNITSQGMLSWVTRYRFDPQRRLHSLSEARLGRVEKGKWIFYDVTKTTLSRQSASQKENVISGSHVQHVQQQPWDFHLSQRFLMSLSASPAESTLPELYTELKLLRQDDLSTAGTEYSFWARLLAPLAALVMISLSIPFVFGPLRTVPTGVRIVVGTVIGFGFYTLNQFFGPFSLVYGLSPILAAALPVGLFAMLSAAMLLRYR